MADRFEDLRTLLTAISVGGVTAAAAELGIAKSAISRRLSDLERRLGVELIDRTRRRFALTSAGAEYARRARMVLASLDDLDASVAPSEHAPIVGLRAPAVILTHAVLPAIAVARAALADERMILRLITERDAAANATDLVIDADHGSGAGRLLLSSGLVLCASPAHLAFFGTPLEPEDLDRHPAIAIGPPPQEWRLAGGSRPMNRLAVTTLDVDAAAAAAIAGLGIAQLPDRIATPAIADGRLIRLMAALAPPPIRYTLAVSQDASRHARKLADAIVAAFRPAAEGGANATEERLEEG